MRAHLFLLILFSILSCKHSDTGQRLEGVDEIELNENPIDSSSSNLYDTPRTVEFDSVSRNANLLDIDYDRKCVKCDIPIVRITLERLNTLDDQMLFDFLCTFENTCSVNVEFSEYSNEVLYKVLSRYPDKVIQVLHNAKQLDHDYIYQELGSPLLDYNYNAILRSVGGIEGHDRVRERIIEALNKAIKG